MTRTKTVLTCVIQYCDDGVVRLAMVGWDEADRCQADSIKEAAIRVAGLENYRDTVECVRFVEMQIPVVPPLDPDDIVCQLLPACLNRRLLEFSSKRIDQG